MINDKKNTNNMQENVFLLYMRNSTMAGSVAPPAFINEVGRPPVQERTAVTPQLSPNIQPNNTTVPERAGASVHTCTNNKRCVNR